MILCLSRLEPSLRGIQLRYMILPDMKWVCHADEWLQRFIVYMYVCMYVMFISAHVLQCKSVK